MAGSSLSCGCMSLGRSKRRLKFRSSAKSCTCSRLSPGNTFVGGAEELQSRRRPCALHLHNKRVVCHSPKMGGDEAPPTRPGKMPCMFTGNQKHAPFPARLCCYQAPQLNVGSSYTDILEHRDEALTSLFILCKASRWSGSLVNFNT